MRNSLLRKTVSRLARGIDRAFAGTALAPSRRSRRSLRVDRRAPRMDHAARVRALATVASFYGRPEFLSRQSALLPQPAAVQPEFTRVRSFGARGEVIDLRWPSAFEPLWTPAAVHAHLAALSGEERAALGCPTPDEAVEFVRRLGYDQSGELRDKYLRRVANRSAHARWFKHSGAPRPCVVLIHGYMGGNYLLDERIWPLKRIFNSGIDVVLSVLPWHGLRRDEARGYRPPAFPSSDPRFTIEGFRQLVLDQRALFAYLREGRGVQLGVMGMSLGGYAAALLATLEDYLRLAVLFVPMASIEESAWRHGHMHGSAEELATQRGLLQRAHAPVSPFARPSLLPSERVVVVAGEADQVTGVEPARALAQHFGAQLSLFHGGHLLHAGRDAAFQPVWRVVGEFAATGSV